MLLSKGRLVTIEGVDASGKTTQIKYLKKFFKDTNKIIFTREPGGSPVGDKIRDILCKGKQDNMLPLTELLLFNASRLEHYDKLIKPKLEEGYIVICDRFIDSTYVYQYFAGNIAYPIFEGLNNLVLGNVKPDLTIVLDIDTDLAAKRHEERDTDEDRFEKLPKEYHRLVRKGYLEIAVANPGRVKILNADTDSEGLHQQILKILNKEFEF
ncbi:MAG: dTMP kinase [Rickettsiales bacterium]|jgi:dTMP kinase|nr:dTMP kinase [Rickettsiales bacterium]